MPRFSSFTPKTKIIRSYNGDCRSYGSRRSSCGLALTKNGLNKTGLPEERARECTRLEGWFKKYVLLLIVALNLMGARGLLAVPINNYHDTMMIYNVLGTDKYFAKKNKGEVRLYLSPFYQHAGSARDKHGTKVPIGDRLGKWNMSGLAFGGNAAPKAGGITDANYHNIYTAFGAGQALAGGVPAGASAPYQNLITEANFNPDVSLGSSWPAVNVKHEKLGLRSQLTSDFGFGLGVSVKWGLVDYKERPTFEKPADGAAGDDKTASDTIYNNVFAPQAREKLFKEISLDVGEVRETAMEDTHLQLFWSFPMDMKEEGEHAVTLIPHLALGMWLPTGKVKNQDRAFSLDTGNGGFYGLTFEGSLGFDFPKMVQLNLGGGAVVFMTKELSNYRVPSTNLTGATESGAVNQRGFYPWKTNIKKSPGITWYANASLKAEGYNGVMSLYFDYIYAYHEKDAISLRESTPTRATAFGPGVARLEEESCWKNQLFNIGLDYRVTKNLLFGCAVQAPISGVKVFKATTILGSMTLLF